MELGNLTQEQAFAARDAAAAALAPAFMPMDKLLAQQSKPTLKFGIPAVDNALQGGLMNGSITELVGASGRDINLSHQFSVMV
jgi:RecA/RadA recombinase